MMKTAIFVQARMNSKRLPGKMMTLIAGKPLVQYVVERLKLSSRGRALVLLTSNEASDDPIAAWCHQNGIEVFRGPLDDVLGRFIGAVDLYQPEAFVRISADSPLIDAHLVDHMIDAFEEGGYDLVTNVMPRSYPRGQSVEIINAEFFKAKSGIIEDAQDREHVTSYFYRHPTVCRIRNVANPLGDFSSKSLCVDTPKDLEKFKEVVGYFNGAIGSRKWFECLAAGENPSKEARSA